MKGGIPEEALRQFNEGFLNSPYIGRAQIHDKEEAGPHKFYYLGFYDVFGVSMPIPSARPELRGRRETQLWPLAWVRKRLPKLDKAVDDAMAGKFIAIRHNARLKARAIEHGKKHFRKPKWHRPPEKVTATEKDKLPLRGRKKRRRRKLKI